VRCSTRIRCRDRGLALIVFGILTLRESRIASLDAAGPGPAGNPYLAGIVTSVTNPYFWIWWLTIGSVLLLAALSGGVALAIVFMAGHWAADLGWYTLVSSAVHHGRTVLSPKAYRVTLALCGIFLVLFGGWFWSVRARGRARPARNGPRDCTETCRDAFLLVRCPPCPEGDSVPWNRS
jgi:threonine/homoserine/homoserine lactone efflux protein